MALPAAARRRRGRHAAGARRGSLAASSTSTGARSLVRAWQPARRAVALRAEPLEPGAVAARRWRAARRPSPADRDQLELAIERMRFALGVDDDLADFYAPASARDPLLGPLIRRRPWLRPRRRPWPWEALAWAVTKQLIEAGRAARDPAPHRPPLGPAARAGPSGAARRARRRGDRRPRPGRAGVDGPRGEAGGRPAPRSPARSPPAAATSTTRPATRACCAIREIGPWTVQCLGPLRPRRPRLAARRRPRTSSSSAASPASAAAPTVEEVEEFYAPYAPYGLAGPHLAGLPWPRAPVRSPPDASAGASSA